MKDGSKLGVAVVGLGEYSVEEIIPPLQLTRKCFLAAVVTGDSEKGEFYRNKYNLGPQGVYSYESFGDIASNDRVDMVYIVLPNALHAEYCVRTAEAGKHIICEKPLAVNLEECEIIQQAVTKAGVQFSMGYRLHFDPFNREMMRLGQNEILGKVEKMTLLNAMRLDDRNAWRLNGKLSGGGPLMNNGIYCIQAAIYVSGKLPVAVDARYAPVTRPDLFNEVEEGIEWDMYFGEGVKAICQTSYSKNQNVILAQTTDGWFELSPAYEYRGLRGRTITGPFEFEEVSQQARQMDSFAQCILAGKESLVPLSMGIRDMKIISAIYESARKSSLIHLDLSDFVNE